MESHDVRVLARYNSEVARGIVHTENWRKAMGALQERYDGFKYLKIECQGCGWSPADEAVLAFDEMGCAKCPLCYQDLVFRNARPDPPVTQKGMDTW